MCVYTEAYVCVFVCVLLYVCACVLCVCILKCVCKGVCACVLTVCVY